MKKMIKLRGELVLSMLIALIFAFGIAFFIRNQKIIKPKINEDVREEKIYNECIRDLEEELMQYNLKDKAAVADLLQDKYSFLVGYEFYVVDEEGIVVSGTNSGLQRIRTSEVKEGKRQYEVSNEDENVFKLTGCDYLKDEYYLYYIYLKYDENDTGMVAGALIGALVCFFILIWRRISYISIIRASVAQIAKGDLSHRVPYRYKNELRGLAEDINEMTDTLEHEEQKKNEFLTNVSHDIRTPLTTILGYLEMIRGRRYNSKEELDSYVEIMSRKGKFLSAMLEDFFQYSKLASQDIKMDIQRVELNELLRQFYEDEEEEFSAKQLGLRLDLYKEPIYCNGDAQLLARAVNNLLGNALKYSRENSTVIIKTEVQKSEHIRYGILSISNEPRHGISEEEVKLLFERLYKKDAARSEEGSGLGLAIVKNIIKLHGGRIEGYKEGELLTFKVFLKT